jgi:hypothetical protein
MNTFCASVSFIGGILLIPDEMKTALLNFLKWFNTPLPWISLEPVEVMVAIGIAIRAFEYGAGGPGGLLLTVGALWLLVAVRVHQYERSIAELRENRRRDAEWYRQKLAKARAEYVVLGGLWESASNTEDPLKAAELKAKAIARHHAISAQYLNEDLQQR